MEDEGGSVAVHYEYDAFGNVILKTGNDDYSYQFSTKSYDILTGLSYYNFRNYDPIDGRWISRDPIAEEGGYNLYCFVNNETVSSFDFKGL